MNACIIRGQKYIYIYIVGSYIRSYFVHPVMMARKNDVFVHTDELVLKQPKARPVFQNKANPTSCYSSPLATSISTTLEIPSFTFMMVTNELPYKIIGMSGVPALPCGYHVVNLRLLKIRDSLLKEALLILHRRGSDCSFIQLENACKEVRSLMIQNIFWNNLVHAGPPFLSKALFVEANSLMQE